MRRGAVYRRNCKSQPNAQQNARHFISTTTRPLATPFDRERPEMLNSAQKNTPASFSQRKASKCATPAVTRLIFDPGALLSSTPPLRALIGVPSQSYGGGGVAREWATVDIDASRRMYTAETANRTRTHNKTRVTISRQPLVHSPRRLTGGNLGC